MEILFWSLWICTTGRGLLHGVRVQDQTARNIKLLSPQQVEPPILHPLLANPPIIAAPPRPDPMLAAPYPKILPVPTNPDLLNPIHGHHNLSVPILHKIFPQYLPFRLPILHHSTLPILLPLLPPDQKCLRLQWHPLHHECRLDLLCPSHHHACYRACWGRV